MVQKTRLIFASAAFVIILTVGIVSINIHLDWGLVIGTPLVGPCVDVGDGLCTPYECVADPSQCERNKMNFYLNTFTSEYREVILFIVLVIIGCIIYKIQLTRNILKDKLS